MAQIIKLRRSSTAGKVPTTSDLNLGELAINTNDGRIFFEKNDGSAAIKHVITSDSQTTGSIEITGNISGSTIYASGNTTLVGNVGIGTTSPQLKTHIIGPEFTRANETSYGLAIAEVSDEDKVLILGYDDAGDTGIINAIDIGVAWKNLAVCTQGGRLGIGVTDPEQPLDVKGSVRIRSTTSNEDRFLLNPGGAGDDAAFKMYNNAETNNIHLDASSGKLYYTGGKLGIGTTSPATALQVSGSLNISQQTIPSTVTTALDFTDSNNFKITLGTNTTLSSSNEASAIGSTGVVVLIQDGTGGRTVALPATWKTPKGQSISFDTGANDINIISYYVIDASTVAVNYIGDFS
jgi:hypothetical protein